MAGLKSCATTGGVTTGPKSSGAAAFSMPWHASATIASTSGRHEPHPVDARVASHTACTLRAPLSTASMICAFDTSLQSQMRAVSGMAAAASGPRVSAVVAGEKQRVRTVLGQRHPRCERLQQRRHDGAVAEDDGAGETLVAHDQLLVDAA